MARHKKLVVSKEELKTVCGIPYSGQNIAWQGTRNGSGSVRIGLVAAFRNRGTVQCTHRRSRCTRTPRTLPSKGISPGTTRKCQSCLFCIIENFSEARLNRMPHSVHRGRGAIWCHAEWQGALGNFATCVAFAIRRKQRRCTLRCR